MEDEKAKRKFALQVLGCVVGVLGTATIIGFAAAGGKEKFDWGVFAEIATALGTSSLAVATLALVRQTRRDVEFASESLDASKRSLRASDRPLLVPTAPDPDIHGGLYPTRRHMEFQFDRIDAPSEICFVLRLWNQGNGPALVTGIQLSFEGKPLLRPLGAKFVVARSAGSDAPYRFSHATDKSELELCVSDQNRKSHCDLIVEYTDIGGYRYETEARITIQPLISDRVICSCGWFTSREIGDPLPEA